MNFTTLPKRSWSYLFYGCCIAVLAGIVHVSSVLIIPHVSPSLISGRLFATDQLHATVPIAVQATDIQFLDPATAIAACPYDLSQQPLRVTVPTGDEILTVSFHSTDGRVFYAVSDRAAQKSAIEVVLMTRRQLDEAINRDEDDEVVKDVRLLSPVTKGLVVVRVLSLQPDLMKEAKRRAMMLQCAPEQLPETN